MSFQDVRAGRSQRSVSVEDERTVGMSEGGGVRRGAGTSATRTPCDVEGCDRKAHRRGVCGAHYTRWREHGDVLAHIPVIRGGGPLDERGLDEVEHPDPVCVDCGAVPWGGTIRCKGCLDADLSQRVLAKRDPWGDRQARPAADRTCVRQVSVPARTQRGSK